MKEKIAQVLKDADIGDFPESVWLDIAQQLIDLGLVELDEIQRQAGEWSTRNFPDGKPYQPLLGLIEELGELAHAHLKAEQGIRTEEDHEAKRRDAVGDIVVFLMDYCNRNGLNLRQCLLNVWAEVKERDWQASAR